MVPSSANRSDFPVRLRLVVLRLAVLRFAPLRSALLGIALVGCTTLANAQPSPTLLWQHQGVENVVSITTLPDQNGDDRPEVVYESYDAGAGSGDHLFCISGASSGTGSVIWSTRPLGGPSNSGGYGENCLRTGEDLTGDGTPDLLYGAAWGSRTAFCLDAADGSSYWSFDSYSMSPPAPPVSGWVYAMDSLGSDLTLDGYPEVVFCLGSDNNRAYCANGRTGAVLWSIVGGDAFYDVRSIEDINADGIRDVILGEGDNSPRVQARSGANGAPIWAVTQGSCQSVAIFPDQNGDGIDDVVAASWDNFVRCLSGSNGAVLWQATVGTYSMRVVPLDDVNEDGVPDVAVASWDNAARVYSGADGSLLWRAQVGTLNGGDVWAIDRVADVTGDGINDVCCGSFDYKVYLMDGVDGSIEWAYSTGNRVFSVRGVPDLSGNGYPDVVAGTQRLTTGGKCYALEGHEGIAASVDGTNAPRLLLSRAAPNPFRESTSWIVSPDVSGEVELAIFDPSGRRVITLFRERSDRAIRGGAGESRIEWDGRDSEGRPVPTGAYWARLREGGRTIAEERAIRIR